MFKKVSAAQRALPLVLLIAAVVACQPEASVAQDALTELPAPVTAYDVSILYGAENVTDRNVGQLIGLGDRASDNAPLLARQQFEELPALSPMTRPDEDSYGVFRVVAIRTDPCANTVGASQGEDCQGEVRLTLQPGRARSPDQAGYPHWIFADAGIHLAYRLSHKQIVAFLNGLLALNQTHRTTKYPAEFSPQDLDENGRLKNAVHPLLRDGHETPFALDLKALVLRTLSQTMLYSAAHFTVGRTPEGGFSWKFGRALATGFFSHGIATCVNAPLPALPEGTMQQSLTSADVSMEGGEITPSPRISDSIEDLADNKEGQTIFAFPQEKIASLVNAAFRIENPNLHDITTVDCVSCHVTRLKNRLVSEERDDSRHGRLMDVFGIDPNRVPNRYHPRATTFAETTEHESQNFHLFGYVPADFTLFPTRRISARVANDTARVVEFVNGTF